MNYSEMTPISVGRVQIQLNQAQTEAFERVRRCKSVLDFGCGDGHLVVGLLASGVDAWGVGPDEAVEFCKRHADGKWKDRFSVDCTEHKLDAVEAVVCTSMEMVESPGATIHVLWDHVKDSGQLVVVVSRGGDPSPFSVHKFDYERLVRLAATVAHAPGKPEYVADITQTDQHFVLHIRKEPLVLKYCQLFAHTRFVGTANDILQTGRFKTGVFNWARVFNGQAMRMEDLADPSVFDVIHLQLAGDSFDYPTRLRRMIGPKGSKTKLVVNVDYPPEAWPIFPPYPELMLEQLRQADIVFAQNVRTSAILSEFLEFAVPLCPHPVDTDDLKAQALPYDQRARNRCVIMSHKDLQVYNPYWILKDLGFESTVIGYQSPNRAAGDMIDYPHFFYSHIMPGYIAGEEVVRILREQFACIDLYTHSVQGRATMECAGLGVPCLGYGNVDSQRECFPDLTVAIGDVVGHRRLLRRLMEDAEFYDKVSRKAMREVEQYSFERCKAKFLRLIEHDSPADSGNGASRPPAWMEGAASGRILIPRPVLPPEPKLRS